MEIYAITCMTRLEMDKGLPYFGTTTFVGYYPDLESAQIAVEDNWCDIAERCYNYAVIEAIEPGLYPYRKKRWFYKHNWDIDKYESIEEPDFMKHFVGILS